MLAAWDMPKTYTDWWLIASTAVLSVPQALDTTNQGLQFGQSGGLNFGNFGLDNAGSVDLLKPQQPAELEHQPSSQHVGSAPSNQGLDIFNQGGPLLPHRLCTAPC